MCCLTENTHFMHTPIRLSQRVASPGIARYAVLLAALVIAGCEDHEVNPESESYFPMTAGNRWEYTNAYHKNGQILEEYTYTEAYLSVGELEFLNEPGYKVLWTKQTGPKKWIKRDGGEYFVAGYYLPSYKFLDTSLPLHGSWSYGTEGIAQTKFTIDEIDATKTVKGTTYHHVIVVTERYLTVSETGGMEEHGRTYHYYARGIGEIYSYYVSIPSVDGETTSETWLSSYSVK
jgi:hypothetical protein